MSKATNEPGAAIAPHDVHQGEDRAGDADLRPAVWLCGLALLGMGEYAALFGPVLPELAGRTGTSLGAVGAVVTALAGAAAVSTLVTGRAVDRIGVRAPLVAAVALNGAALVLLPWVTSWPLLLGLGALLGLGDGGIAVATHVLVGQARRGDEAAALNRLNVFFGLGAVVGPATAALARALGLRAALLLLLVGAAQWLAAALLLRARMPTGDLVDDADRQVVAQTSLARSARLWLLGVLLLVYVGLELGLGVWVFSYAREAAGLSAPAAALLSGGFWGALTVGRLVAPTILRRVSDAALLVLGAGIAAAGTGTLLVGGAYLGPLVAGVLVVGVGFGPIWPVTFALAARWFPAARGTASGILAMASAVGAGGLPWVFGAVLDAAGPAALIAATFAGCLALLGLAVAVLRAGDRAAGGARTLGSIRAVHRSTERR